MVTVEVERPTHDLKTGVPADYDAMAAVDPSVAVWIVSNRELGHKVVDALIGDTGRESQIPLDPSEIKSPSTPLDRYAFEVPGCTAIRTLGAVSPELFETLLIDDE